VDYSLIPEAKWLKKHRKLLHSTGIKRRAEVMEMFHDILDTCGIRHWLAMSALLGIHREGHLLKRDEDVDFFCYAEDLIPNIEVLKAVLVARGFDVRGYGKKARLIAYMDGEEMALMGHFKKGKYRTFKNRRVPAHMFGKGFVRYEGVVYPCMSPILDYLKWQYKNWKKPYYGNPSDRDRYMNKRKVKGR
jgi:hypothetical protein